MDLLEHAPFGLGQIGLHPVQEQGGFVEQAFRGPGVLENDRVGQGPEFDLLVRRQLLPRVHDDRQLAQVRLTLDRERLRLSIVISGHFDLVRAGRRDRPSRVRSPHHHAREIDRARLVHGHIRITHDDADDSVRRRRDDASGVNARRPPLQPARYVPSFRDVE